MDSETEAEFTKRSLVDAGWEDISEAHPLEVRRDGANPESEDRNEWNPRKDMP